MNEKTTKRRDYIKNALIVFLIVMLALTFFSNTIMNYSLPEVSAQYCYGGSISAKVRGSGTVEADDPYLVKIDETRTVASVLVREGDIVEKDQIIMLLEEGESTEYELAVEELNNMQDAYYKALLAENVSPDTTNKVQSGASVNVAAYEAQINSLKNDITKIEDEIKVYNDEIAYYTYHLELAENGHTDTSNQSTAYSEAVTARKNAEKQLEATEATIKADASLGMQTVSITAVNEKIKNYQAAVADNQAQIDQIYGSTEYTTAEAKKTGFTQAIDAARLALESAVASATTGTSVSSETEIKKLEDELKAAITALDNHMARTPYSTIATQEQYKALNQAVVDQLNTYVTAYNALEAAKKTEATAKAALNSAGSDNTKVISDYKNSIAVYEINKTDAQSRLTDAQDQLSLVTSSLGSELDLTSSLEAIAKKRDEISKLLQNATGATVAAPISGIVQNISVAAGQDISAGLEFAMIQPTGNGFTMEISVTSQQAMGLSKGDIADIQNSWYYSNISAVLSNIKVDATSQGKNKILEFEVEGDVTEGQNISISIGQKSQDYSNIVPNSAIREDNNGKFILTVVQKSSPLGNRYYAQRCDVEVLASDDTKSAVSGAFYGGEFVITTSTKPVQAGQLVRLAE